MLDKTGIYAIINKVNGKIYIGSAQNNFNHRYKTHIRLLKANKHHSVLLQRAFNKYGINNFKFKILEICNNNILEREQYYLDLYESYNPSKGYNICQFSNSTKGYLHTEDSKELMRQAALKRGRFTLSEDAKEKIGLSKRKLTIKQCIEIKRLLLNYFTIKEISKLGFPISESNIKHIRQGRHWSSKELGGGLNDWRKELIK